MQQIIVYRNPLEAALWESLSSMDTTNMFPIMVGAVSFVFLVVVFQTLIDKHFRKTVFDRNYAALIVSGVVSVSIVYTMWI